LQCGKVAMRMQSCFSSGKLSRRSGPADGEPDYPSTPVNRPQRLSPYAAQVTGEPDRVAGATGATDGVPTTSGRGTGRAGARKTIRR
jgi:hypothetical protein